MRFFSRPTDVKYKWFAWYPVHLCNKYFWDTTEIVWLEWVIRIDSCDGHGYCFDFETAKEVR